MEWAIRMLRDWWACATEISMLLLLVIAAVHLLEIVVYYPKFTKEENVSFFDIPSLYFSSCR